MGYKEGILQVLSHLGYYSCFGEKNDVLAVMNTSSNNEFEVFISRFRDMRVVEITNINDISM